MVFGAIIVLIVCVWLIEKNIVLLPNMRSILFFIAAAISGISIITSIIIGIRTLISVVRLFDDAGLFSSKYYAYYAIIVTVASAAAVIYSLFLSFLFTYISLRAGFNELHNKRKRINTKIVMALAAVVAVSNLPLLIRMLIVKYDVRYFVYDLISIILNITAAILAITVIVKLNKLWESERIICQCCGAYFPSGAYTCKKCGNSLETYDLSDNTPDMIICPSCSAENEAGKKFCKKCGNKLI